MSGRLPVPDEVTGKELFKGEALPHFNEVDECAGLDGVVTYNPMASLRFPLYAFCLLSPLCVPLFAADKDSVTKQDFGSTDGQPVTLYTLTNSHGTSVSATNYGGTIVKLLVPDRTGKLGDIVLGFDNLDGYLGEKGGPYFGATIGRYGNRIAKGQFSLDGHSNQLPQNDGDNSLHGGKKGFDK